MSLPWSVLSKLLICIILKNQIFICISCKINFHIYVIKIVLKNSLGFQRKKSIKMNYEILKATCLFYLPQSSHHFKSHNLIIKVVTLCLVRLIKDFISFYCMLNFVIYCLLSLWLFQEISKLICSNFWTNIWWSRFIMWICHPYWSLIYRNETI